MEEYERLKLEELKALVKCNKNFTCIKSKFKDLCSAKYSWEVNELEGLEDNSKLCKFEIPHGSRLICDCDLRIFIAQNLDKWIASSTAY